MSGVGQTRMASGRIVGQVAEIDRLVAALTCMETDWQTETSAAIQALRDKAQDLVRTIAGLAALDGEGAAAWRDPCAIEEAGWEEF